MEKAGVLKKLEQRKKMFEEYIRQLKTPAGKRGTAKKTTGCYYKTQLSP